MRRRDVLVGLGALALTRRASAESAPIHDLARWLAGVAPAPGGVASQEWLAFARAEDERWERETERVGTMRRWARRFIVPRVDAQAPVVYPFAGPDALHPIALFDDARALHLYGLEPVGVLPDLTDSMPMGYFDALGAAMAELHRLTFFRTGDLATGLRAQGVLPLLLASIVRMGGVVSSVSRSVGATIAVFWVDAAGAPRRLEYTRADLSNAGLAATGEIEESLRRLAPFNTLVKASSYLLSERRFSRLRHALSEMSGALVEDDTGIPYRSLADSWDVELFGRYATPREPFADRFQPELAHAYETRGHTPLPFGIGYNVTADRSNLLVATRRRA